MLPGTLCTKLPSSTFGTGEHDIIKALLQAKADPNINKLLTVVENSSDCYRASLWGSDGFFEYYCANCNARIDCSWPLTNYHSFHYRFVAINNHRSSRAYLLIRSSDGFTPLHFASLVEGSILTPKRWQRMVVSSGFICFSKTLKCWSKKKFIAFARDISPEKGSLDNFLWLSFMLARRRRKFCRNCAQ